MNNHKRILSLILALVLAISTFTPVFAQTEASVEETRIAAQEVQIGDKIYYIFSTDKNAKDDLIKSQEKREEIQTSDGLNLSDNLFGRPVGAGRPASYTINFKVNKLIGVGRKSFDWNTLPEGLELQFVYIDANGYDYNVGSTFTINRSNATETITKTFDIPVEPMGFGIKTNVDTETYLTDVYLDEVKAPDPWVASLDMTFDLVQVPSTKLDVKWVDVNNQELGSKDRPSTNLKDILTFNFIANRKFDLPNQDKEDPYFRLINKVKRSEVKDMEGATALVDDKKDGEEVTLDGKIYKLTTSYNPALNEGSKIQLMYMPDVIDRTDNPGAPTPDKYVRVTIDAGEGTKLAQGETKKVYDVRVGKALKAEHYPKLEISDTAKYKEPITWTVKPETVINSAVDILGNAAKTAAETITAANLKAVDTTALQGQDLDEKFWHKGVELADNTSADKKDAFAALLKDATVTDATNPARTTAEAGDKVGTLLVTFKDGSTLEVPNQKLIVKSNTVKVAFDKAAGKEHPLRDGDTTVKGKITASSSSDKFPVSVDGAVVTIKKGDTVLSRTLANADGSFVAGVKDPLIAGEDISVVVTLPESKIASAPVTEKVQLNPDKLNSIIPTGQEVVKNLKGKKGVDQAKVTKLEEAITKAFTLVDKGTSAADQMKKLPKSTVTVDATGQKSLDDQYETIKKAIEALTGNKAPVVTGTAFKEIFKDETLNLEAGIEVKDADSTQTESDIQQQAGKDFSYKVYTTNDSGTKVEVTGDALNNLNKTPGTYEVVYMAKDKSGAEGTFTMTLLVKDIVYTKIAVTTDPTTTKYLVKDKDTKATPDYTGTVVTLTKNNGKTEEAKFDKATGKFKVGDTAIEELSIAPKEVAVADSPAVVTATYEAGKTKLTANAGKNIIVQIDSDGNGVADSEENFDITKAKSMEITNQPTLNYELDLKTGKATLDLKPLVVKVTDSLGNFKYFGYEEIKGDSKFALALGTENLTDKAAAKELTTADTNKKVKVTLTYKENKTLEAETSAITVEDKRPDVIENPTDPNPPAGYYKVVFNAGDHGGLKGTSIFFVKDGKTDPKVKAPEIVPAAGYKKKADHNGWDKDIPATIDKAFEATAQYELDEATSETPKDGYTPITFDALDKGKIDGARTKTIYVNPAADVNLSEKAPKVTANTGYSFKAWDPAVDTAKRYTKEERILATYTSDELISDKEKAGYIKVTFAQGDHGKFNVTDPAQKTEYWVKPDTIVDLREKAPKLTPDAGYIHTGWSQDLVVNYPAGTQAQTITAQYGLDSDYSTTEKAGYTKITFEKGTNGEFAKDAKTELWVNPAKELTLPAPGIVPHPGYSHTGWTKDNAAVELNTPAKYTTATTITAAYESDISETEKAGYVKVSFDADKNGTIANNVKKDFWVNPNKEVNLTDRAPAVTPNSGYLFIKWDHKLVDTFKQETTIKATYASAGDIKTEQTDGFTKVTFDAGQNGKFAEGAQVTYWVNPDKELVLPEPRVIPNKGFEHTGWDPALTPAKAYKTETTIKATYKEEISTTPVEGHQEIKFVAGDDGTFADGKKEFSLWVKPDTLLDLRKSAPEVTVTAEGKTFTGWDRDLVGTFKLEKENGQPKATVFTAQYAGSTSETPVPGWTEITFKSGQHGRFGTLNNTPVVEKKLWVDPKADVKLSEKAPKTIDDKNWSFDKWMDGQNPATGLDQAQKYTEAKTYTASYKSDISATPQEGFVKITFAPGTDGTFEQGATTEIYVRKDKEVDIADKAPKATPNNGLSFKGWAIGNDAADLTKIKVSTDTTITAQYTKAISDKPVEGWTRLQFNSGENGRFVKDAVTVKWVDPKVKLTLGAIAPGILPDKNYRLSAWNDGSANVELETEQLFTNPATFTAQYEKISSDTEITGFTKITFKSGDHGNFGTKENNKVTEKNIWVNPKSDVKLSEIAPELVIDTNWSFDKWMDGQAAADMDTAKKYTEAKTYTATYESDFSDVAKEGFVKVEFKAGDHGKFEQVGNPKKDQQTIVYVRKDKEVDMTVKEPKVTPDNGYYFTGWDKPLQKVYTADTIHTGKNEKAIATEAVDGWTQITFNAGDKGLFKPDAKTVLWVKPNTKVALDDQVPGLEIEKGYSCIGWKKNAEETVTDLTVPATYDKSTTFTAAYESDFSKGEKEGFVEIKFKAGDNGNFGKTTGASSTEVKNYSVWVRPDKEVDLTDQAPKVYPNVGWKLNGWDKTLTITVNAQTSEAARTFTAQYVKDSDTSKTEKPGYKKITFNAGDHGTFANDAETVVYVNPDSEIELSTIAPKVNPAINYSFKAWNNGSADVALDTKTKYATDTTYTAQYESDISDTAKEGFVEVKFSAGTDGEFKQVNGVDQKTTFYVKKDKLVDLSGVAPIATGKDKKTFTGWDSDLKRTFADASTTINAKYTESISDKYVEGWTQLDFDQGDHGRFVKGQKNVKWVDPAVDLKLDDIAPTIKADPNWTFKAWNDGTKDIVGTQAQKFTKATTFTATYEDAFSPGAKEGFVKVTFDQGAHGKFVKEAVKEIYVKKDVDLDLREKAPTVIPNQGWGHKGWTINNQANDLTKVKASDDTTIIKADYAEGKFDATNITKIVVLGPTQMGYGVGEKLNLAGLKVIAIDDAGLQETYDGVDKIKEAGFTIEPADKTELKMDDNGKHIVVTKVVNGENVTGQTETTLTIHENKSAKAENVKALNQNIEENGKVTDKPKTTTTVTGKVKPGATVKITSADGQTDLTPQGGVTVDPITGTFTAEVTKQKVGDKIQVIATEKGKQPADPADATVERDADNNGVADKKEQFDITKATGVKILQNPSKMNYSVTTKGGKTNFDANGLLIEVTDGSGKSKTYTYKDITEGVDKDKFTLSPADKEKIGLKEDGSVNTIPFTVKVTGADTQPSVTAKENITVILDADGNGKHDKDETTTITSVIARNIGTGTTSPKKAATFTTIEGVAEPGSIVTIKFQNNGQEVVKTAEADAQTGAYKLELKGATEAENILLPAETEVKASAKFGDKEKSNEISTKVFDDLDADGINDKESGNVTERPSALASNIGRTPEFTTITGEGEKGATITAKATIDNVEVVVGTATVGSDGKYTIQATTKGNYVENGQVNGKALKQGTLVSVTAKLAPKGESAAQTTHVFNDSDKKGQPDSSKDFDVKQAVKMEVISSPDKMVYSNGDKLNLNGLSVLITDVNGNQKIYKYEHNDNPDKIEFIKAGLSVDLKQDTVLSSKDYNAQTAKDGHNGRKLVVTLDTTGNTVATTAITGETPTALEVNQDQTAKPTDVTAANQGTDNFTKVRFKAVEGAAIKIYKADDANKTNLIDGKPVKGTGDNAGYLIATLNTKLDEGTLIEITAQETGKSESSPEEAKVVRDKNGDWKDDAGNIELIAPDFEDVKVGDKSVKVEIPTDPSITKIIVQDQAGNEVEAIKEMEGTEPNKKPVWKVNGKPVEKDGKLDITTDPTLKFGLNQIVKVIVKDSENNEGSKTKAVQPANLPKMPDPIPDSLSTQDTKVTGKSVPGAIVKVQLPGQTEEEAQEALVKSDGSFEFVLPNKLADKDKVIIIAESPGKYEGTGKATVTVGLNLKELENTKRDADKLISDSKTANNFDPDNNKYDKNLEDKTKAAQDILDRAKDNKDDNDPSQTQVNKAEEDLRDAINQKNADDKVKVVEKAVKEGQKPTEEQIKEAQDAIDKVKDPTAKKELQDRLDLAKKIAEAEERLKQDDITGGEDGKTPKKPGDLITELEKAVEEGKKQLDPKTTPKDIPGATKKIDDALKNIDLDRIQVGVSSLVDGIKTLHIKTSVSDATVVIKIDGVTLDTITTDGFGEYAHGLSAALKRGQRVVLEASKEDFNPGGYDNTVK